MSILDRLLQLIEIDEQIATAAGLDRGTLSRVLLGAAGLVLLTSVLKPARWIWKRSTARRESEYVVRRCECSDLAALQAMVARDFAGTVVSSLADMRRVYAIDAFVYWKVVRRTDESKSAEPFGYFAVNKLTAAGEKAARAGQFCGASPLPHHVTSRQSGALYIAAIEARNQAALDAAIGGLTTRIESLAPRVVFTRTVTPYGINLATRHGYRGLKNGPVVHGEICMREFKASS